MSAVTPSTNQSGYPIQLLVSLRCTHPTRACEKGIEVFVPCGSDNFHWSYHESQLFIAHEVLSKLRDPNSLNTLEELRALKDKVFKQPFASVTPPREYTDETGRVRTLLHVVSKDESSPEEAIDRHIFECPSAPGGKHVYQIIFERVTCHAGTISLLPMQAKWRLFSPTVISCMAIAIVASVAAFFMKSATS